MLVNENKDNSKRHRYQSPGWWGDFQLAQLDVCHCFHHPQTMGFVPNGFSSPNNFEGFECL